MDDVIRDLARHHGQDELSDSAVSEVKKKLSNAYIDEILDTGQEIEIGGTVPVETTSEDGAQS
jgi:hypothetical protein